MIRRHARWLYAFGHILVEAGAFTARPVVTFEEGRTKATP